MLPKIRSRPRSNAHRGHKGKLIGPATAPPRRCLGDSHQAPAQTADARFAQCSISPLAANGTAATTTTSRSMMVMQSVEQCCTSVGFSARPVINYCTRRRRGRVIPTLSLPVSALADRVLRMRLIAGNTPHPKTLHWKNTYVVGPAVLIAERKTDAIVNREHKIPTGR